MQRSLLLMLLLRVSRALIPRTATRCRSSVRHASAQPLGQRGLADGSEGITLFSSEAIQSGAAPAVTVFWLHGLGDTADGWAGAFMPGGGITLPSADYKVVLPTAETLPITLNGGMQMPAWFDIVGLDRGSQEDEAGMQKAAARLEALVALEDLSTQVVLGGFSQGGAVALTAGLRCKAQNVAAVVGTSTWLPLGDSYPAALAETALERPVALHHGEADEVVRTSWGVASKERLVELGCRVSFDTYPGMAHSACPEEFEAISSFLRKEIK